MLVSAEEEWEKKLSTTGIVSDTKKVVRSANNADAPSNDGTRATTGTASAQHSQAHVKPGSSSRPSGYVSTTSSSFGRSNRIVESAEQWRKRLWPSKAITSFVRIITRCSPPVATVGESLFSSQLNAVDDEDDNDKHSAGRRENAAQKQKRERAALSPMDVGLKAHWTAKELRKVPESFGQDINLHSSIFFLLAVEECRASCLKAPEFTETGASTGEAEMGPSLEIM